MVITILTTFWLCIAACILVLYFRTKKGRMMFKTLWRSTKVRVAVVVPPVVIAIIALVFFFQPKIQSEQVVPEAIFRDYSRMLVEELANQGVITIDPSCELDDPQPELAYMLPALVGVYHDIVKKPTTARLTQLDDTLRLSFDGYKQFKNRTINILKGVKKKLGPRYALDMQSEGENHTLVVTYKGEPWRNEQLCALPATEAGIRESTDAALLMSITRHISDFDFNYEGEKAGRGKRALNITIPESLNYTEVFEDLFFKYTDFHELQKVKTTNMGSMFKLSYEIRLKDASKEKEFIDALRCRNGNLEISCGMLLENPLANL